jgi:drug/metabolite transporter (DMT)-like permease
MIALLLGLVAALCWSVHDLVARVYAPSIGPFRVAFWVVVSGAVLLAAIILWRGRIWNADWHSISLALAMGVVYAGALGGLLKAFSLAPVSIVGPFTAGYPALIVLWGFLHGLSPSLLQWLAVILIIIGAVIVGRAGPSDGGLAAVPEGKVPTVIISSVVAVLGFATAVILGQAATHGLGEFETTFVSRIPAAAILALLMLKEVSEVSALSRKQWLAATSMGAMDVIAVTSINVSAFYPGKELGAMAISSYGALAALLAMIFLKERVALGQWFGIAMIVVGVGILGWPA